MQMRLLSFSRTLYVHMNVLKEKERERERRMCVSSSAETIMYTKAVVIYAYLKDF